MKIANCKEELNQVNALQSHRYKSQDRKSQGIGPESFAILRSVIQGFPEPFDRRSKKLRRIPGIFDAYQIAAGVTQFDRIEPRMKHGSDDFPRSLSVFHPWLRINCITPMQIANR